ncbi:vesicular inhibitory amino acid transporter-like [Exaiptasia diaphana]|uniref:Amino acid transporter transmembrane domain-containing protein n=1 Tax=Exaiptasia diaphana TaxID=2652724 RepID=A0A913YLT4_EXADI|nr:vesicular inhibitory amino acid transporter-like [Exaiptasia diaphana]
MSAKEYKYEILANKKDEELEDLGKNGKLSLRDKLSTPDQEIQSPKEISTWKMVLNLLNYMEGVGFLAIPYAVREGGITALLGICLLPFILGYTANLLSQCIDEKDETGQIVKRRLTFEEIAKHSWAPLKIKFFIMSQQFPQVPFSTSHWACVATLIVLPTVFLKAFSQIAWLSLLSLVVLIVVIVLMLGFDTPIVSSFPC